MATKMKMVMKGGKMVPAFAADGKGKMQMGGVKKMQDGGERVTGRDIRDAQRAAKLARINAGTEPSTYQKVSDITGKVANVATTVGQGISAVQNMKGRNNDPNEQKRGGSIKLKKAMYGTAMKPAMMKKGGATKYQKGGSTTKKKVDNSITGKMQRGLDYILGSDKLRATGVATNNYLKPYAAALNKTLRPASPKTLIAKKSQMGGPVKNSTSMMKKSGIKKK